MSILLRNIALLIEPPLVVNAKRYFVEVSNISEDWLFSSAITGNPSVKAIKFFPGAAGDVLTIKDDNETGPVFCKLASSDGEERVDRNISDTSKPFIDFSDSILSTGAIVLFVLKKPIR